MSRLKFIKNKSFVRHKRQFQLPSQQTHCPATTLDCTYFSIHCKIEVDNGQLLLFLVFVRIKFDPWPHKSTTSNSCIFPKSISNKYDIFWPFPRYFSHKVIIIALHLIYSSLVLLNLTLPIKLDRRFGYIDN